MSTVRRKHKVNFLPAQKTAREGVALSGWWYAGCPSCGLRLTTSSLVSVCQDCDDLGPYGRPEWDRMSDPQVCCLRLARPITDPKVLQNYRCGGDTPWWLCSGCSRAHPYDPNDPTRGGRA